MILIGSSYYLSRHAAQRCSALVESMFLVGSEKKMPQMNIYPLTSLVTLSLVALAWILSLRVGRARANFADALEEPEKFHSLELYSDPDFMVVFRNHQNLLEHLILVLPALWIFAVSVSDGIASILGLTSFIGRVWWARNYPTNYSHRPAFILCFFLFWRY